MDSLEANERQERDGLESIALHGMRAIGRLGCHHSASTLKLDAKAAALAHLADAPQLANANANTNEENSNLTLLPQYNISDGSLSDILQSMPLQYHNTLESNLPHYNALLLEDEQPFMQQPTHLHTLQQQHISPHIDKTIQTNDTFISIHDHLHKDFYMYDSIFKEQQLPPSIMTLNYNIADHSNILVPPPNLPPLPPVPPHTRRPPLRKGTTSYREAHIQSERQRRQDMAEAFNRLRSLLPSMQENDLQEDRCTILGHVIKHVQDLDSKVQELGKVKAQLMQENDKRKVKKEKEIILPDCTSNVSVRLWGKFDIFITLNCPKKHGLWPNLLTLLQDTLQLDVQNVALSSTPFFCVHSIYAKVAVEKDQEVCSKMLQERIWNFLATHTYDNIMC